MDFEKTAQTLLFLGLINEDKMKATPRIHFPEIYSEINILSQKIFWINILSQKIFWDQCTSSNSKIELLSWNKFTSPKCIPRGANERKHFQLCCKYFPRVLQKHLIDQEGGGVLKRRKTWNSSTLFTRFWRFWRCRPDWDIPPILGADETQYLICGRTPPSEQLAEHYSADCSLTRCTIARLFKSAITHVHSQAAPNCR